MASELISAVPDQDLRIVLDMTDRLLAPAIACLVLALVQIVLPV
jgi:hypothetical protein